MKYNIETLKRKMLVKYPFFGSVITNAKFKESKDISTAETDGKAIYYNPDFLEKLSVEEQMFILAHEVCHIAFNHILRSKDKDTRLWNIATDAVINQFLKRDGLTIVEGGVDIAEAIAYDAEEFYEKLLQEKEQIQQQQSGSGQSKSSQQQSQSQQQSGNFKTQEQQNGGGSSQEQDEQSQEQSGGGTGEDSQEEEQQYVGHDTHSMWEEAVKKHDEEQEQQKKNKSILDKIMEKLKQKQDKEKKQDEEEKQDDHESIGEKEAFEKNTQERQRQLQELREEIARESAQAGKEPGERTRTVGSIGTSKPIVDWRYYLREATTRFDVDWSFMNAEVEYGVLNPKLEEYPIPETEIVLDTSGSINEELLKNFLRECKNILHHSALKVGCFDTKFYGFHEIRRIEDIENMQFKGGGGTNFNAAVGAFSRRVQNKIIFTDGYADMPDEAIDAIWIVFGSTRINPKGGKVIYITPEQLERLYLYEIEETKGKTR